MNIRNIRNILLFLSFTLLISCGGSSGDSSELTVINNSDTDIYYVRISSSSSNTWGSDVLGSNKIIKSGSSYTVSVVIAIKATI